MRRHWRALIGVTAILLLVSGQSPPAGAGGFQSVVVSPDPIAQSPQILDGRVYALAAAGDKIVVGGTFTTVQDYNGTTSMTRNRMFAFNRTTGLIDPTFAPSFNNDVNAIEASPDGSSIYVGGQFTAIDGVARSGLVKLSMATGQPDPAFTARTDKLVSDLALTAAHGLILGGRFTKIASAAGSAPRQNLGAVDPTTGAVLPSLDLPVTGSRDTLYPYIQEIDVSPDGNRLVIAGNFLQVGGLDREQLALIDLTTQPASVANWATTRYHPDCAPVYDHTYMRDVAFSPDSSFFMAVTTGAFYAGTLCDAAARWEVNQTGLALQPTWVSYTGGDTHWHVTVTDAAVYVGGHMRWENNPTPSPGGDNDGPGAVSRQGIAALDPLSGVPLSWNPTRHRGRGVEAFLTTPDYLYVGSDTTRFNNQLRYRLAILPTSGGTPNPLPDVLSLPVDLYAARSDGSMYHSLFDGQAVSTPTAMSGPALDGNDWSSLRDGFAQQGQFVYFGTAGAYYRRTFNGTAFGASVTNLSTSVGYVDHDYNLTPYDQPYNVDTTRALAYYQGRLYYTRTNDSRLFWRWYSLESGIIGSPEFVASGANWTGVTGLEIAGHWLYASWSDNKLYRAYVDGPAVDFSSRTLVNDGAVSSIPWAQTRALVFGQATGTGFEPPPPAPPVPLTCPAGQWKAEYYNGTQLAPPTASARCETSTPNYDWGTGAPAGAGVGVDQFSVRWTATRQAPSAGTYTFTVQADDGVRLYIDGVLKIDQWRDQSPTTFSTAVPLPAGSHQIQMEYYENSGGAVARLTTQF
jgi:hypothetical protein